MQIIWNASYHEDYNFEIYNPKLSDESWMYQIRIMGKNGIPIYSGNIEIRNKATKEIDVADAGLFAGFISAFLSVSEET